MRSPDRKDDQFYIMSWPTLGGVEREPITEEAAMQWHDDALRQLVAVLESGRAQTERERFVNAWYLRGLRERAAARRELIIERSPRGRPEGRSRHIAVHLTVLAALHGKRDAKRIAKDVWSVSSLQVSKHLDWARGEVERCVKRCLRCPTTHLKDGAVVTRTWTDDREVLTAMDDYLRGLARERQ